MNIFLCLVTILLRVLFRICYRYKVYGIKKIYQGGAIIAPNHVSFLDPPLVGIAWPEKTYYLARASLFHPLPIKLLLTSLQAHPVHSSSQDIASFKAICHLLSEEKKVVIFPEGERSKDGCLKPLKIGVTALALRTKCPIIPVYIDGTFDAWPRSRRRPKLTGKVVCIFGQPIFMDPYLALGKKNAQEMLTQQVQQSIENLREWFKSGAIGDPP